MTLDCLDPGRRPRTVVNREKSGSAFGRRSHQDAPALGLDQRQRLPRRKRDALDQSQPRHRAAAPAAREECK